MATVTYLLKGSANPSTIYVRVKQGNKNIDITKSTGYSVDPKAWSITKKGLKDIKDSDRKALSLKLTALKSEILRALTETDNHRINSEWLENVVSTSKGEQTTESSRSDIITDCIKYIIDTADSRPNAKGGIGLSERRVKGYNTLLKMVETYQGKKHFRIKDVDKTFGDNFLSWMLIKKGYSKGYSIKIVSDLKTVCNDAASNGIDTDPSYKYIKVPTVKNENIIYLSPEELETIERAEITNEALINARRWLILGCHIGQRGADLLNLNASNLKVRNNSEVLEFKQRKADKPINVPLPDEAKEILSAGFPYKTSMATFNKHIKEVCKIAEIKQVIKGRKSEGRRCKRPLGDFQKWELISSHVCRRSYATNYYSILPTTLLMKVTGHETEKMLLKYIGKSSLDYVDPIIEFYQLQAKRKSQQAQEAQLIVVKSQKLA